MSALKTESMKGIKLINQPKSLERNFFIQHFRGTVLARTVLIFSGILMTVFCYLFVHFYVGLMIYHFVKNGKIDFTFLTRFAFSFSGVCCFNMWIFNRNQYPKLSRDLAVALSRFKQCVGGVETHLPSTNSFVIVGYGCLFMSVSLVVVASQMDTYSSSNDQWVETWSFGWCQADRCADATKMKFVIIDLILFTIGSFGSGIFVQTGSLFLCQFYVYCLELTRRDLADKLTLAEADENSEASRISRNCIVKYRKIFKSAKRLLLQGNQIYSTTFFFWYGLSLIATCQGVTEVLENYDTLGPMKVTAYFVVYGSSLVEIFIISCRSAKLPEKMDECYQHVEELSMFCKNIPYDVFGELHILLQQMKSEPKGVNVGGCFVITRSFFVSYLGAVVTYVFLAIQIKPGLLSKFQGY